MLQFGFDILFRELLAHIEAAAHAAGIALLSDELAGLFVLLILVKAFCRRDVQVPVLQAELNFIFVEAGQLDIHFIAVIVLPHIRLHQVLRVVTVKRLLTNDPSDPHQKYQACTT